MTEVYEEVVVGGTFDRLHIGHRMLLRKAALLGRKLLVGITSDHYVKKLAKTGVENYLHRAANVVNVLRALKSGNYFEICELDDEFGPAVQKESIDAIVVSEETLLKAIKLNEVREARGFKKVDVVAIGLMRDSCGKVISSTRIRLGEIDAEGKVIKRL